jgi:Acetyltransferases
MAPDSIVEFRTPHLAELKRLLEVFADAFEDHESYQAAIPSDEYLNKLLAREDFIPLVAVADGKVVGGLAAYVLTKFEQERSEIYIYDLAVLEEYRCQHIATGLINKLREIAREKRAYVIYVQADHGDDPAIKLYESLGTREDVLHFDIVP